MSSIMNTLISVVVGVLLVYAVFSLIRDMVNDIKARSGRKRLRYCPFCGEKIKED